MRTQNLADNYEGGLGYKYLGSWEAKLGGELEAEAERLLVWVGEAGDPDPDGLLPLDLGGEVGEVVEVLPPHHPHPDYPVPHLRGRRHVPRRAGR